MRFTRPLFALLGALLFALVCSGCATQAQRKQAYVVSQSGAASAGVISAMDAMPGDTGPQEIIGVNIPFIGTGLALKAGLIWNGAPGVITIPVPVAQAPQFAPMAAPCAPATQTIMVPETYYETETRQVPRTRMVPRTVVVPQTAVPIPQAETPCPSPPVASLPEPTPATEPACSGTACAPPGTAVASR